MDTQPDRIEQFKADLAEMKISDPSAARDQIAARVGLGVMGVGVVLTLVAYGLSHGTQNDLAQRDAIIVALIGLALVASGAVFYLKGTMTSFLRFWLVRDLHERRAQTDRLLAVRDTPTGGE